MKITSILYNDLTSNQINIIFENKLYLKENKKELNTSNTQKVSYQNFKTIYLPKIIKFLNTNISDKSSKEDLYTFDKNPLGLLNSISDINRLCLKPISGSDIKIDPFNIKDIRSGASAVDLNKYKQNQTITLLLKKKDNSVLGSENSNKSDSIYVINIPPVFTEIHKDNLSSHRNNFGEKDLVYSKFNNFYYYNTYSIENVKFSSLPEENIEQYMMSLKNKKQKEIIDKRLEVSKNKNRGVINTKKPTISEK